MMRIKLRHLATPLIAAGAAAAAIAVAPSAAATANGTNCNDRGAASVCSRAGHSSIHVERPARVSQGFGFGNFGTGPNQIPLWAIG